MGRVYRCRWVGEGACTEVTCSLASPQALGSVLGRRTLAYPEDQPDYFLRKRCSTLSSPGLSEALAPPERGDCLLRSAWWVTTSGEQRLGKIQRGWPPKEPSALWPSTEPKAAAPVQAAACCPLVAFSNTNALYTSLLCSIIVGVFNLR